MTASKQKGTKAETEVVNYLKNWWPAAERRALSGNKDKGDVAGIPGVVVEVKAAVRLELTKWQRETLQEMENAGAVACALVVKRPNKQVSQWDAWLRIDQLPPELRVYPHIGMRHLEWARMDLFLAVAFLRSPWLLSLPTTA